MSLLLGTHTYAATGDAARRQSSGISAAAAVRGVTLVDVQFARGGHDHPGIETMPVLELDALTATGRRGARKPLIREVMDALCTRAEKNGHATFAFMNADIQLSQEAADCIGSGEYEGYLVSREDFDAKTGESLGIGTAGVDVIAVATSWWRSNRHRFRPYIAGEAVWDNVYTAIVMCHARAVIENRRPLVRHEVHPTAWTPGEGPYARYTQYLAALDAPYFSLWCRYWAGLQDLRRAQAPPADELALASTVFVSPLPATVRAVQMVRALKARARYAAARFAGG